LLANEWDSVQLAEWGLDVWENQDDVEDIEEVNDFNEDVNFIIKCENLKQLEELKDKIKITSNKTSYSKFIELLDL